jgi:ribosome-binding factor A
MAKSYRIERINETIKELLSELLLAGVKDPRVGMVTITAVRVANDMSTAKVHYSVMGDEQARADSRNGLLSARNFLRREIARELKLRTAPELRFVYDDSLDKSLRIEEKLREAGLGDDDSAPESDRGRTREDE